MRHLKKMKTYIISLFALLLITLQTISVNAEGALYAGELQLFGDGRHLGINMYASYLPDASEDMEYIQVNYSGSGGSSIGIATQKDYGYDGRLKVYATFTRSGDVITDAAETYLEYYISDVNAPDGINVTAHIMDRQKDVITVQYIIEFDNYVAKDSNVLVSFTDNFSQDFFVTALETGETLSNLGQLFYTLECQPHDWAGTLYEYYDVTEMPGAEWQNIVQNQEIIDSIQDSNLSIMDTIKAGVKDITGSLTNWFSTLITNLSTWYTGMTDNLRTWFAGIDDRLSSGFAALYSQMSKEQEEIIEQNQQIHEEEAAQSSEQHDELINGYDTSQKNELDVMNDDFDASLDAEEEGVNMGLDTSLEMISQYTIPEQIEFDNFWIFSGLVYIPYLMQLIFDNSGYFQVIISIFFSLFIATHALRLLTGD